MAAPAMRVSTCFKCLNCKEVQKSEPRNRGRQRYCSKEACRKASKAASQRAWMSRRENADYWRGKESCERVKRWREKNPGYWRRKEGTGRGDALQEICTVQNADDKGIAVPDISNALQEICEPQPSLIVGLIASLTGYALQDDIVTTVRRFVSRGEDILGMGLGRSSSTYEQTNTPLVPGTAAARASPV